MFYNIPAPWFRFNRFSNPLFLLYRGKLLTGYCNNLCIFWFMSCRRVTLVWLKRRRRVVWYNCSAIILDKLHNPGIAGAPTVQSLRTYKHINEYKNSHINWKHHHEESDWPNFSAIENSNTIFKW